MSFLSLSLSRCPPLYVKISPLVRLSLYFFGPFHNHPLSLAPFLSASPCPASCRRRKNREWCVSVRSALCLSATRVTSTMRLLKSQVDQVDSPPSAGLTTNQHESRLIAVNSEAGEAAESQQVVLEFVIEFGRI